MKNSIEEEKNSPPELIVYSILRHKALYICLSILIILGSFWWLGSVLLPFIAGIVIAYLLNPFAHWLEKKGFTRLWATIAIFVGLAVCTILVLSIVIPLIYAQAILLVNQLPADIKDVQDKFFLHLKNNFLIDLIMRTTSYKNRDDIVRLIQENMGHFIRVPNVILSSLLKNGLALVHFFLLIIITPVVAFYFLLDWQRFVKSGYALLPRRYVRTTMMLVRRIDTVIAAFIRGQLSVCLFLGFFYGIGLTLLSMNFGLVVGFSTGVLSFIPYVGTITGLFTSLMLMFIEYGVDYTKLVGIVGLFALGQFIEGNYLTPQWVGTRVGLHPLWVMFALFVFGSIFGFLGILVAVPVSAALGVLVRFAFMNYKKSHFYLT